ncbi:MAG TPA: hypothetical protein VG498_19350, partial [Terriglobales bacterium]|nr:hypothetical protein [Terriglobales bacterium]
MQDQLAAPASAAQPFAQRRELNGRTATASLPAVRQAVASTPDVVAVSAPTISPSGKVAVIRAYPGSAPQAQATTDLVNHLRQDVLPPLKRQLGAPILVGGFTAGS